MELQILSKERIEDARVLLSSSRWSGAYYIAGYSLECALKSCVLHYVERTGVIFEDKRFVEKCWTHDLELLLKQADLQGDRVLAISANPQLGTNWIVAKDWTESSRYRTASSQQAQELFDAISDNTNGVLQWIQQYW